MNKNKLMAGIAAASQQMQQRAVRTDMDVGAAAAKRVWDANRERLTVGWFAGFITQMFAMLHADREPAVALVTFDTIRKAV